MSEQELQEANGAQGPSNDDILKSLGHKTEQPNQPIEGFEEATGKVEDEEPAEESSEKEKEGEMEYTDGKARDSVDELMAEEKLLGTDRISPFGTSHVEVLRRKIETESIGSLNKIAERTATRIYADRELQGEALLQSFREWKSTNWASSGGKTKERSDILSADSLKDFETTCTRKSLSELQEMAMKLGFTPSFDRNRIIRVLRDEYLKRQ